MLIHTSKEHTLKQHVHAIGWNWKQSMKYVFPLNMIIEQDTSSVA